MIRLTLLLPVLLGLVMAPTATQAVPQPAGAVPVALYSGRWFEIARTPNQRQTNCQAPAMTFTATPREGRFRVRQTCRQGSPAGPLQSFTADGEIIPGSANARMRVSFLVVIRREYVVLDRAADNSWAILASANGRYGWLLSRRPALDADVRTRALARMGELGFPASRLQFPIQAG